MEDKPSADAKVERDRGRAGFSCPFSLAKNGTGGQVPCPTYSICPTPTLVQV